MKTLIIGGTRFIGRFVVQRLLDHGHEPVIYHRGTTESDNSSGLRHIHGHRKDLGLHSDLLQNIGIDSAIDMIPFGPGDAKPLIDTLKPLVRKLVAISSADVYQAWLGVLNNRAVSGIPISETDPVRSDRFIYSGKFPGADRYDKLFMEEDYIAASVPGSFETCIARLPMVFGPYDSQTRTAPFDEIAVKGNSHLTAGGGLLWLVHRSYVENTAEAIVDIMERGGSGQVYNVGDEKVMTMGQWIDAIGRYFDIQWDIHLLPDSELPEDAGDLGTQAQHIVLNTEKIRLECGYRDIVTFDEGLKRTLDFRKQAILSRSK